MPQDNLVSFLLTAFLLPPGISIALSLPALLSRRPRIRMLFLSLALLSLYLASIPATSLWLRGWLETSPPFAAEPGSAEAIVVLGADRRRDAPEYGGDTLGGLGLERLRYAAKLHRQTGLPVAVSGGSVDGEPVPEAELMRGILKEFGVETAWVEGKSRNTYENALFTSRLLKGVGIGEILLVTHAWHMPRAKEAFEQAGLRVIPTPTGMASPGHALYLGDWLPRSSALHMSQLALHEMLGRLWYHYRYYGKAG